MAKLKEGTQEYKNLAALLRETRRQIAEHDPNEYVGNYIQALATGKLKSVGGGTPTLLKSVQELQNHVVFKSTGESVGANVMDDMLKQVSGGRLKVKDLEEEGIPTATLKAYLADPANTRFGWRRAEDPSRMLTIPEVTKALGATSDKLTENLLDNYV